MQIQVNTDRHIEGSEKLTGHVEEVLAGSLSRFQPRITRVEVHLTDQNSSQKSGEFDKRCVMEARLAGMQPISVSAEGSTVDQAIYGAADNLEKILDRTLARLESARGRKPTPGEEE